MIGFSNKQLIISIITLLFSYCIKAQDKVVTKNDQQWIQYYSRVQLNQNWTILADASYRWKSTFKTKSQYLGRIGLGYDINKKHRVSGGVANLGFYTSGDIHKTESRLYQEWLYKTPISKVKINHRFRLEERFFTHHNGVDSYRTSNLRYRYSIMANFKIAQLSLQRESRILQLKVGNELFLNSGNNTNLFDQNRVIISPTVVWSKNFKTSITWSGQYSSTSIHDHFVYSNIFWLQVRHKIDLKKRKMDRANP